MKLFKKIVVTLLVVLVTLFTAFAIVMVRPNLSLEELEPTYFTSASHYLDVTIQDLEGNDLSLTMHYQDWGEEEDPVVVLVHGAFSSSHTFLEWTDRLVEEGYRVILPDLPYFGLSGGFEDYVTSYRRSAATIKYLLDTLEVDAIDIAGNSLGGGVSWFFASEYPSMVRSLTLVDAMYPYVEQGGRDSIQAITQYDGLTNFISTLTPKFLLKALLSTAYGDPERLSDEIVQRYYDIIRKEGTRKAILKVIQEEEPEFTYQARLESLTMDVYVMWGDLDTWINPSYITSFKNTIGIPEDHIYTYETLGHLPMEEDPTATVSDYLDILQEI